ncbi:hypothetical protein QZH41_012473, partial [Actinostola sp. cb2023]
MDILAITVKLLSTNVCTSIVNTRLRVEVFKMEDISVFACKGLQETIYNRNAILCLVHCSPGFILVCFASGQHCEVNINECNQSPSPCGSGGTCIDGVNGFTCHCSTGYTGPLCNITINDCVTRPCQNGGTCTNQLKGHRCQCSHGFTGLNCEVNINDCAGNPCQPYQQCIDGLNRHHCQCPVGYTGSKCDVDINECTSQPCLNNGTCHDGQGNFSCTCPAGFQGPRCEHNTNECQSNPCFHGGTCHDRLNHYYCQCPPGFLGNRCEANIIECLSDPCLNNGTCQEHVGLVGYSCRCPQGFTGQHCQFNSSVCHSSICQNNGTCHVINSIRQCNCTSGWTGAHCAVDIDECQASPCKRGSCQNTPGSFYCACPAGYTGVHCEVDFNECSSIPCGNGGTCTDHVNGYSCTCAPGYTGIHCESLVTDCATKPCQNGGTCSASNNKFTCTCKAGYTGLTCDVNIDECSSNPCKNGGTCVDGVNSFQCRCVDGYQGNRCESLHVINFRRGSYIPMYFQSLSTSSLVSFRFRTTLLEGLLIYQGADYTKEHPDHLAVELHQGSIRLSLNLGMNTAVVTTGKNLNDGVFHKLTVVLSKTEAEVTVESNACAGGTCKAKATVQASSSSTFYGTPTMGGLRLFTPLIRTQIVGDGNFVGCIESAPGSFGLSLTRGQLIAAFHVDFLNQNSKRLGANLGDGAWHQVHVNVTSGHVKVRVDSVEKILQLSSTAISHLDSKLYMGSLLNSLVNLGLALGGSKTFSGCARAVTINRNGIQNTFELAKSSGYTLPNAGCKKEENCNGNVCANGGTCVATWSGFVCTCLADFSGKTCQISTSITYLSQSSYIEAVLNTTHWLFGQSGSLWLQTVQSSGLVMYAGWRPGGTNTDFLMIDITSGRLRFTADLGSGSAAIVIDKPISDGLWHNVTWSRRYKHVRMVVDGTHVKETDIQGSQSVLDITTGHSIYVHIGGFPYSRAK